VRRRALSKIFWPSLIINSKMMGTYGGQCIKTFRTSAKTISYDHQMQQIFGHATMTVLQSTLRVEVGFLLAFGTIQSRELMEKSAGTWIIERARMKSLVRRMAPVALCSSIQYHLDTSIGRFGANCSGFALALLWLCSGFALALLWLCSEMGVDCLRYPPVDPADFDHSSSVEC
jgi:hypothetical protein